MTQLPSFVTKRPPSFTFTPGRPYSSINNMGNKLTSLSPNCKRAVLLNYIALQIALDVGVNSAGITQESLAVSVMEGANLAISELSNEEVDLKIARLQQAIDSNN